MYIFLYASFFIKDLKQNKELFENNQPEKPSEDQMNRGSITKNIKKEPN